MNRSTFLTRMGLGALAAMLPKAVSAVEPEPTSASLPPGSIQRGGVDPEKPFAIPADKITREDLLADSLTGAKFAPRFQRIQAYRLSDFSPIP